MSRTAVKENEVHALTTRISRSAVSALCRFNCEGVPRFSPAVLQPDSGVSSRNLARFRFPDQGSGTRKERMITSLTSSSFAYTLHWSIAWLLSCGDWQTLSFPILSTSSSPLILQNCRINRREFWNMIELVPCKKKNWDCHQLTDPIVPPRTIVLGSSFLLLVCSSTFSGFPWLVPVQIPFPPVRIVSFRGECVSSWVLTLEKSPWKNNKCLSVSLSVRPSVR